MEGKTKEPRNGFESQLINRPTNTGSSGQQLRRSRAGAICQKCAIIEKEFRGPAAAAEPSR